MPYAFPPEIAEPVRRRVTSGQFLSEDEVLKAALRLLDERDEELSAIQEGLADLEAGRVSSLADVDTRLRAKYAIGSAR
jgi:putative addiction module CopG family antidote